MIAFIVHRPFLQQAKVLRRTDDLRRILGGFTIAGSKMGARQRQDLGFAHADLDESHDRVPAFLPQSIQPVTIDQQEDGKADETNQRCQTKIAQYRDDHLRLVVGKVLLQDRRVAQPNDGHERKQRRCQRHTLQTALFTLNPRDLFLQVAVFFSIIINDDAPQKLRIFLMLAHFIEWFQTTGGGEPRR